MVAFAGYGQNANTAGQAGDRPLKVLKKPAAAPGYCASTDALTRVRVTFNKSGKVTEVALVVPSACKEFDERAIAAALRIKFEPAMKNGEPVTVTKVVEYKYYRY